MSQMAGAREHQLRQHSFDVVVAGHLMSQLADAPGHQVRQHLQL